MEKDRSMSLFLVTEPIPPIQAGSMVVGPEDTKTTKAGDNKKDDKATTTINENNIGDRKSRRSPLRRGMSRNKSDPKLLPVR